MDGMRGNAYEGPAPLDDHQGVDTAYGDFSLTTVGTSTGDEHSTGDHEAAGKATGSLSRRWQHELPRWLTTLDSERTRREYEKAVRYFFQIPGVSDTLEELTFDLLLAYRGSLALRAERTQTNAMRRYDAPASSQARRVADPMTVRPGAALDAPADRARETEPPTERPADHENSASQMASPLAPATVNIRLTALRQFLAHCSLWGYLPDLAPERMRAALRRLRIERRRPYQILAEPEWADFLDAALAPARTRPATRVRLIEHKSPSDEDAGSEDAPDNTLMGRWWGTTEATRVSRMDHQDAFVDQVEQVELDRSEAYPESLHKSPAHSSTRRSPAGLTGAYTARRDHALLALALATGLRAIELCSLDLADLTREWSGGREEWWLVLPDAKTKGQHGGRTLPLAPALAATLIEYASATGRRWTRATDRATPLFLSQHYAERGRSAPGEERPHSTRGRLSPQQVRRIVDRVERQWLATQRGDEPVADGQSEDVAETRAISPHALRHSTAVALLEGNERSGRAPASVEHVRGWLGHFDIRTTQGYLAHLDARRHRRPFVLQSVDEPASSPQPGGQPDSTPPDPRDAQHGGSPVE